ncbi:uncharacterized protein LOC111867875 [Cryptotermes secundus]|uniref:uncharacterized protein LOC111867875 n=1 Tax=Cryptotermes secundus TaxID=105785 RepID=UPI000CD7B23E|nr:uncharacterized protein LOC111867875 [Cryptotermes secundus]
MRRANGSGHYYQPLSQYSDQDTVEQQNDALADELKGKVQMLKSLSLNIGDEVKYQDRLLREVDDDFEKTGYVTLPFIAIYEGQSNENGSPCITHMVHKLVTLEFAYGTDMWWGLGKAQ